MQTSPAKLIFVALVAAVFGLAGAASRTCRAGATSGTPVPDISAPEAARDAAPPR